VESLDLGVAFVSGIFHLYYLDGVLKANRVVELDIETAGTQFVLWPGPGLVELHAESHKFSAVRDSLRTFLCNFACSTWVFNFKVYNTSVVLSLLGLLRESSLDETFVPTLLEVL